MASPMGIFSVAAMLIPPVVCTGITGSMAAEHASTRDLTPAPRRGNSKYTQGWFLWVTAPDLDVPLYPAQTALRYIVRAALDSCP